MSYSLYFGDCLEEIGNISNKSVDLILCDRPMVSRTAKGTKSYRLNHSERNTKGFLKSVVLLSYSEISLLQVQ